MNALVSLGLRLSAELDVERLTRVLVDEAVKLTSATSGRFVVESAPDAIAIGSHGSLVLEGAAPGHEDDLRVVAMQAAVALDNAKRFGRVDGTLEARRVAQARLAADVGLALIERGDLKNILSRCCQAFVDRLDVAFARIWTLGADDETLELQASAGLYTHIDGPHRSVPVGSFKIGLIASERAPRLSNDIQSDPRLSNPAWAKREGMIAFAGYPLVVEDRLVGVMAMFSRSTFSEDAFQSLASIANHLALGIERRRADAEALKSGRRAEVERERLRRVFEIAPAAIATTRGPDHVFETANALYREMVGGRDLVGKPLREALPELDPSSHALMDEVYRTGEARSGTDARVELLRDGVATEGFFDFVHQPLLDVDDAPYGVLRFAVDVTAKIRARMALEESEERYRFLADASPEQIWTASPDGGLDYVNQRVLDYFGRPEHEMLGNGWATGVHAEDIHLSSERWMRSLSTGERYETEFRLKRFDGTYRWHVGRATALRDDVGKVVKWFGSNFDIEDRKAIENERERLVAALERSNRELDQFAYATSHDLKAPLRGIHNLADWIEEDAGDQLGETSKGHLKLLRDRAKHMEALIADILAYARAGRTSGEDVAVDLNALVREVVDLATPPVGARIDIGDGMPTIVTSRVPLQQVLLNLVGNALKHADRNDPTVTIRTRDAGRSWEISITDNGPGIAPEYHEKIWQIFQRLRPSNTVEGTGIGLSIVKKTVEGRGGRAWVESKVGEGATFRFTWPKS